MNVYKWNLPERGRIVSTLVVLISLAYFLLQEPTWPHIAIEMILIALLIAFPVSNETVLRLADTVAPAFKARTLSLGFLIVIYAFSGWPFFWHGNQYAGLVQRMLLVAITATSLVEHQRWKFNTFNACYFMLFSFLLLATLLADSQEIRTSVWKIWNHYLFTLAAITVMLSMEFEQLKRAGNRIIGLYILISLPSILILLSLLAGVDMPYISLDLGGRGEVYRLYPFGILEEGTMFRIGDNIRAARTNGFSDEPGALGTYAIFFIILNRLIGNEKTKKKRELLLHLLGVLSMSLFYFASAFILLLPRLIGVARQLSNDALCLLLTFRQKKERLRADLSALMVILCGIATLAGFVMAVDPETNFNLYYLTIARLLPGEAGGIAGDSRAQYMEATMQYLQHNDWATLLTGNGPGSNSLEFGPHLSSWAAELYDEGMLSVALILYLYGYIMVRSATVNGTFSFRWPLLLVPAMLSFYQRPEIIGPIMLVFWVTIFRLVTERRARFPGNVIPQGLS